MRIDATAGQTLFPQDIADDNMVEYERDMMQLCTWRNVPDHKLDAVFRKNPAVPEERRRRARHLIRWCLQGDPKDRPTTEQILKHAFFAGAGEQSHDAPASAPTGNDGSLFFSSIHAWRS